MNKQVLLLFAALLTAVSVSAQEWAEQAKTGLSFRPASVSPKNAPANEATITPTDDQVWWGYFSEDDVNASNYGGVGTGAKEDFEAAILIPANHEVVGSSTIKGIRVWFDESVSKITSMKVWISKNLTDNASGAEVVQDVDISTLSEGVNEVLLTTPYDINNQKIYVGYSIGLKAACYPIMGGGQWVANSYFIRSSVNVSSWGSQSSFGKLAIQILAEGVVMEDYNAVPANFGPAVVGMNSSADVPVKVTNYGKKTITSLSYTLTINGTTTEEATISTPSIAYNSTQLVNIPMPGMSEEGENTYTLTITKVNDNPNTATQNSATGSVTTVESVKTYPRTVLIEEFTSESCGNCPRAVNNLNSCMTNNPDLAAQVAIVCHHSGYYTDWLTISADQSYCWFYNEGGSTYAPAFMWDRHAEEGSNTPVIGDLSAAGNKAMILKRLADISYAQVWLSTSFNSDNTKLTVNATCERGWAYCNTPERLTLILTEDNIKAHSQSGGGSNFIHQHVSRAVNTVWGAVLNWTDNQATYEYTFNINSSWKVEDLKVVGFISGYDSADPTNCEVENAAVVVAGETTGIAPVHHTPLTILQYYTIDGKLLNAPVKGINIVKYSDGSVNKVVIK